MVESLVLTILIIDLTKKSTIFRNLFFLLYETTLSALCLKNLNTASACLLSPLVEPRNNGKRKITVKLPCSKLAWTIFLCLKPSADYAKPSVAS